MSLSDCGKKGRELCWDRKKRGRSEKGGNRALGDRHFERVGRGHSIGLSERVQSRKKKKEDTSPLISERGNIKDSSDVWERCHYN